MSANTAKTIRTRAKRITATYPQTPDSSRIALARTDKNRHVDQTTAFTAGMR